MSTTIDNAAGVRFQGSAPADQVTTVQEAQQGKGADGSKAPDGTTPVVVERGDTISQIMAKYGLDWGNQDQRDQFLKDNPQFADTAGGRNPDLIWPGEVVYVHTGGASQGGAEPPTNGTQQVSGPDSDGNCTYQNYVNGQPQGSQYTAKPGENGQPANSVTIGENGGEIRTDDKGQPLTGWVKSGDPTSDGGQPYVYYVNGMPTTESTVVAKGAAAPSAPPPPATGNDQSGTPFSKDGWHVTAGSSQGVALHYFVNGYQIDSEQVVNGRADGPPPIIPPGTNAKLASAEFSGKVTQVEKQGDGTYHSVTRTYANGELVGKEKGPGMSME